MRQRLEHRRQLVGIEVVELDLLHTIVRLRT
jgi:hypothetical protein